MGMRALNNTALHMIAVALIAKDRLDEASSIVRLII